MKGIIKNYYIGEQTIDVLHGLDLQVREGEFIAIMGASGSGKSTLMNILGCLDKATAGSYELAGKDIGHVDGNDLADIRNALIGFVFQGFNLLSKTTALENVELPLFYNRQEKIVDPVSRAQSALMRVGLADRMHHEPNQLSGGQQQRVAIARALVNEPKLILADEPTGNLDSKTSVEIMALFQALNEAGITIVLVTHEHDIAHYAKRNIVMRDGLIIKDTPVHNRTNAADELMKITATVS